MNDLTRDSYKSQKCANIISCMKDMYNISMEMAADTGLLTGAPTTEGTYTFQIAATFTSRQGWSSVSTTYVSEEFTITVRPAN